MEDAPPPSSPPMGRHSDLSKQPSFFGRWLAGAQEPQEPQEQQQQQSMRPSLLGFLFDSGDTTDGSSTVDTATTSGTRHSQKENLIKELTLQLEESDKKTFTLTSKDLRLLLDLPEAKKSLGVTKRGSDSVPCPPPIKPLPVQSNLFDSWDFTSTDELSGDEIQAIMIALAANQQTVPDFAISDGIGVSNSSTEDRVLPLPELISKNARQVSIQKLDSFDGPQYLVSLGDNDGNEVTPPPPSLFSASSMDFSNNAQDKFVSSFSTNPVSLKTGLARQFSIQPYPSEDDGVTVTHEKPNAVTARQVSVQALPLPRPKGSASIDNQDEEGAALHYVVSLTETETNKNDSNFKEEKRPSRLIRKVSVQPTLPSSLKTKGTSQPFLENRPTLEGFRSVSVRMNGGKVLKNFQLGPL